MMTDPINAGPSGSFSPSIATPWHLWVVGGLSLLWNSFGAFDYTMTETHNIAYLAAFTDAQRAYFYSFPWYAVAFWALGVWGAVAGSLLLLMRRRLVVAAFVVSLLGLTASTIWQFHISDLPDFMPEGAGMLNAVIWAAAIALLAYAWWARRRGWLR
jgi:hypothetical protein